MLVVKLLNNLINGVEFDGLKEAYMLPLNSFIGQNNLVLVQKYITDLINLVRSLPFYKSFAIPCL